MSRLTRLLWLGLVLSGVVGCQPAMASNLSMLENYPELDGAELEWSISEPADELVCQLTWHRIECPASSIPEQFCYSQIARCPEPMPQETP